MYNIHNPGPLTRPQPSYIMYNIHNSGPLTRPQPSCIYVVGKMMMRLETALTLLQISFLFLKNYEEKLLLNQTI